MAYKGGKGQDGVYHRIINQIPPHEVYIEAFFGGGSIMKYKKPAACSIAIDRDASVLRELPVPGALAVNGDAISYLRNWRDERSVFVYADPPYPFSVRSYKEPIYKFEMGEDEKHIELLEVLKSLPCMVAISGYWSSLYESSLQGWRSISYQVGVQGGQARTEWLWMNYPEPKELHDYRYLGDGFRQREKITRMKKRWRARLVRMTSLQRYALLSSIADLNDASGSS